MVVTVDYDQLTGALRGLGRTLTDDQLTPAALRRLACDAEILPTVMGTDPAPWTSAAPPGWQHPRSGSRSGCGTAAAPTPAARSHPRGATPTTSSTGATAAQPTWATRQFVKTLWRGIPFD